MVEFIRKLMRPYCTVILVTTVAYLGVMGKIEPKDILGIAGIIVAFHFAERNQNNNK